MKKYSLKKLMNFYLFDVVGRYRHNDKITVIIGY